jgi:hypothetical protein
MPSCLTTAKQPNEYNYDESSNSESAVTTTKTLEKDRNGEQPALRASIFL